jgi:SAM-dependent methyltransferase
VAFASIDKSAVHEAAELIISRFPYSFVYRDKFCFGRVVALSALMRDIDLLAPSLDIGIKDGSCAAIAHFGKPKFSYGGDMPEESTFESMGLHIDPNYDVYENVLGIDAHNIPFPDASFNTVITNDMLNYGVDRSRILSEMTRVLAPGGTLFLSETTGNIKKYPFLLAELKKVVPSLDVMEDPLSFYRAELEKLAMGQIQTRTYFDPRLAAIVRETLHREGAPDKIDDDKRGVYAESLRALAALLADELSTARDAGDGWQVFARSSKPGTLDPFLAIPKPICLSCKATLNVTLDECHCPTCNKAYRSELGTPFVLSDYAKSYSPKRVSASRAPGAVIKDLVNAHINKIEQAVSIFGFDRTTRYMMKILLSKGISVSRIYTDNPLFEGHSVLGAPIVSYRQARSENLPIMMSADCKGGGAKLRSAGYRGRVYATPVWSSLQGLSNWWARQGSNL